MIKNHSDSEREREREGGGLYGLHFPNSSKVILYAPPLSEDSIYYGICYISRGALAVTRNSSMDPLMNSMHRTVKTFHLDILCDAVARCWVCVMTGFLKAWWAITSLSLTINTLLNRCSGYNHENNYKEEKKRCSIL